MKLSYVHKSKKPGSRTVIRVERKQQAGGSGHGRKKKHRSSGLVGSVRTGSNPGIRIIRKRKKPLLARIKALFRR